MPPRYIIIHHQLPPFPTNTPQFASVNEYHRQKFNTRSSLGYYCGYQYFIEKDGIVIQARKDNEEGIHTLGRNKDSIGICLALNGDVEMSPEPQFYALRALIQQKIFQYHIPLENVTYHRKWTIYKSCPGTLLTQEWLEKNILSQDLAQLESQVNYLRQVINRLAMIFSLKKK